MEQFKLPVMFQIVLLVVVFQERVGAFIVYIMHSRIVSYFEGADIRAEKSGLYMALDYLHLPRQSENFFPNCCQATLWSLASLHRSIAHKVK